MSNFISKISVFAILAIFITGCSKEAPRYVGVDNPDVQSVISMGLDRQDFEKAADDAVASLLKSGVLNKTNGKYVVAISRVVNDTTHRIDTDLLIKKIRI
ncbi:MAG: penicillin-binding protein activator LpoB, partial [Campylobacteraceae bacterium]|nr:penicillin-binding protein activator LpoB [Campylobacteraceae bacterium]